ncbi:hypothetical protein RIR_jg29013.t1 [Rhizophagus irregularis DAOM 181602=DAOM 197198]|nr:hypothetical protein RIR_jg29013.t1 [Rhizophagus irregularis DAOM 181602=DAOM 197198]
MSNKIRTRGTPPYIQKIVLNSNNNRRNSERFQSLEDVEEAEGIEDLEYIEDGYLLFHYFIIRYSFLRFI